MSNLYGDQPPVERMDPEDAAAELLARELDSAGVILDVGFDGSTVSFTTSGGGFHMMNVHKDFDVDVHLVCDPEKIQRGPLHGNISDEATVYVNIAVTGLADEPKGASLPTHIIGKDGVRRKDPEDLSSRVVHLSRLAGVDL